MTCFSFLFVNCVTCFSFRFFLQGLCSCAEFILQTLHRCHSVEPGHRRGRTRLLRDVQIFDSKTTSKQGGKREKKGLTELASLQRGHGTGQQIVSLTAKSILRQSVELPRE